MSAPGLDTEGQRGDGRRRGDDGSQASVRPREALQMYQPGLGEALSHRERV